MNVKKKNVLVFLSWKLSRTAKLVCLSWCSGREVVQLMTNKTNRTLPVAALGPEEKRSFISSHQKPFVLAARGFGHVTTYECMWRVGV